MLVGGKANLIYREESLQLVRVAGSVGQERPLYAGSTGKVLGAFQDEEEIRRRLMDEPLTPFTPRTITSPQALLEEYAAIRKQGYAISDGELNIETIGIGAPVRDESGNVWAAISIGAPRDAGGRRQAGPVYLFGDGDRRRDVPGSDPGNGGRLSEINGNITDDSFPLRNFIVLFYQFGNPKLFTTPNFFCSVLNFLKSILPYARYR